MKALDFKYDGCYLSDFGCIVCTFGAVDKEEYSIGSQITFNTTPVNFGKRNYLTSIKYEECITAEFEICKNVDNLMDKKMRYFTVEEQRELSRWLNRSSFLPLEIIDCGYETICFEGSFNLSKIEVANNVLGFLLELTTNRPFALGHTFTKRATVSSAGGSLNIQDMSDEIGYVYPDITITCNESGDLSISNSMDSRVTKISNCSSGEKITIGSNLLISTSNTTHQKTIMNDFNFVFPRISNTFKSRSNTLTFSIPCDVVVSYSPVRKVGI